MATFKNPANTGRDLSLLAQGVLGYDKYSFALNGSYASGAGADESLIVIGYVPADCVLIPHLSRISLPVFDSDGSPTGDVEIGTVADTDALKASFAAETAAAVLTAEDLLYPAAVVGSKTVPTAIVIRVVNVIATLGTGTIVFEPVYRAWRDDLDA